MRGEGSPDPANVGLAQSRPNFFKRACHEYPYAAIHNTNAITLAYYNLRNVSKMLGVLDRFKFGLWPRSTFCVYRGATSFKILRISD